MTAREVRALSGSYILAHMKKFFLVPALLLCAVLPARAEEGAPAAMDRAWRALVATDYAAAAAAFESAAAGMQGTPRHEALYQAALSWTLLQDTASLSKGARILDALMAEAEPEESIYAKSMLMQAWNSFIRGDTAAARAQYANAEPSLPPEELSRALWICSEMMGQMGDRRAADSCALRLRKDHPRSLEALYGIRRAATKKSLGPAASAPAPAASAAPATAPRPAQPAAAEEKTPAPAAPEARSAAAPAEAPVNAPVVRPGSRLAQKAPPPAPEAAPAPDADDEASAIDPKGDWCLQVGAFADKGNAEALQKRLSSLPGTVRIVQMPSEKRVLHLVRIYAFATKEAAERFRERHIKPMGLIGQARSLK